jgi:multidrug efflux system outer membrane protein
MPLDTLTATASLARARAESERAHYNYLGERLVLAQMLDLPRYDSLQMEGGLDIPLPPGPSGGAMINPDGRINSAEARAAEANRIAAETDVRYQGLTVLPTINAVASWNTNGQSSTVSPGDYRWAMTSQVGLSLYYPIFNFWRSDPKREEAQMRVREAELELERIRKGDSTQQQQILLAMQAARAQLRAEEASSESARKAVEIAQILYKEGRATLLDVETAQSRVVDAGLAEDRAKLQFLTAYADLKAIVAEGP